VGSVRKPHWLAAFAFLAGQCKPKGNVFARVEKPPSRPMVPHQGLPAPAKYSRVHIDRLIATDNYPAPVQISGNRQYWYLDEVEAWIASRPRKTRIRLPQHRPKIQRASAAGSPQDTRSSQPEHDLDAVDNANLEGPAVDGKKGGPA
jgi:hypothetical protein